MKLYGSAHYNASTLYYFRAALRNYLATFCWGHLATLVSTARVLSHRCFALSPFRCFRPMDSTRGERQRELARERQRRRRANPELRAREAQLKRQRRGAATTEHREREALAKRRWRQANPQFQKKANEGKRQQRQANPQLREHEAEQRLRHRAVPPTEGADARFKREFLDRDIGHSCKVDFCGQTEEVGKVDSCVQTEAAVKRTCEVQTECSGKTSEAFVNAQGKKSVAESIPLQTPLNTFVEDNRMRVCEPAGDVWDDESEDETTATVLHTVYPCKECGDLFLKEDVLNAHLWQDHKQRSTPTLHHNHASQSPLPCWAGVRHDWRRSHLGLHKWAPRGVQPYECQFCQKGFSQREYLDRHLKDHFDERNHLSLQERTLKGEEPFQCQFCKKGFSQREDRDRHLRDHLDEREQSDGTLYECEECGQHFTQQSQLACHQRLHVADDKSVNVCPNCSQAFMQKHMLIEHMLSQHTDGRPHACPVCGKTFTRIRSARRHEEVVHRGHYQYHCPVCKKGFSKKDKLMHHLESRYGHGGTQTRDAVSISHCLTREAEEHD
ncbi:uncharacterized protein LOC142564094 isoform X2 [Dermacentor variabilis]|uniref:uncharacterized protein LOC142564094 isoform X2 n=1 Tax=Dermacentor variabilis TaxID=34621 RepID=UPI003F5C366D